MFTLYRICFEISIQFCQCFRNGEDGETIVKTASENWVVGKRSDQREFYVVINQKNANLVEINGKFINLFKF